MPEQDDSAFDAKPFLASLSRRPGVYQMYAADGSLLYVGKAKNLKNRVTSYFRASGLATKTMALVARIHDIQVTVTDTETDALLLEHNLIKKHQPVYNILLRDDKSYPYIFLSSEERFPRLAMHRGSKRRKGQYFGPYPSAGAVRESLHFLQKVFQVRQCEDSYFRNRSRPCLQHQIGRCTAPCVDLVTDDDYARQVEHTVLFLKGSSRQLMSDLADQMEAASRDLEFERAAVFRDQLTQLQQVQASQGIEGVAGDLDIISAVVEAGKACVQVLFVRAGRVLGSKTYFPPLKLDAAEAEVINAFLPQFYLSGNREIPRELILSHAIEDQETLQAVLAERAERKLSIKTRVRDARAKWLQLARQTAEQNLQSHLSARKTSLGRMQSLQDSLKLPELPERLECFDISHSSGEATVASCVVFDQNGPRKADYRKFNIEGITGGDDYAAMQQALERRYKRLKAGEAALPDILFIDGGKGQVAQAMSVLEDLQINNVTVVGVAKGTTRKAGFETLIMGDSGREFTLNGDNAGLHLIQHIRDEAHRFAITGHRARRDKKRKGSVLDEIVGVGAKRRRDLLRHFGGLQGIQRASVDELMKVTGINEKIARDIYEQLHSH
ncbi:MAG: excinuclease ABC subunit UvrC [Halieaceae bacterium]